MSWLVSSLFAKMLKVLFITGFLLSCVSYSSAVNGNDCPVLKPCSCFGYVSCTAKGLTEIPPMVSTKQAFVMADFDYNFITRIEDDAFSNITIWNNYLVINLNDNNISYISPLAFRGLENVLLTLNLQRNNLTSLPTALMALHNLIGLDIRGITTFDPVIMNVIGPHLDTFSVGNLVSWPKEFHSLANLKHLYIYDSNLPELAAEDVKPFAKSLFSLRLIRDNIAGNLDGICNIGNLTFLELNAVHQPTGASTLLVCPKPLRSLTTLRLTFVKFMNASEMLPSFPAVSELTLSLENLERLILPRSNKIQSLVLSFNKLKDFPVHLDQTLKLRTLDLRYNQISSIQKDDLAKLMLLETLVLRGNPLDFVHEEAFSKKPNLVELDLANTKLTTVPRAILHLPHLHKLSMIGAPVRCSCEMIWMLNWPERPSVSLYGYCFSKSNEISYYVNTTLQLCEAPVVG